MNAVSQRRVLFLAAWVGLLATTSLAKEWEDFDNPPPKPEPSSAAPRTVRRAVARPAAYQAEAVVQPTPAAEPVQQTPSETIAPATPDQWVGPEQFESGPLTSSYPPPYGQQGPFDPIYSVGNLFADPQRWLPQHGWVRAEYLGWTVNGMGTPPLVTTSPAGTTRANAGVIGAPGTTVLFGGQDLFTALRSGERIRFGTWLNNCETVGVEADYFGLAQQTLSYTAASDATGSPILGRPFVNVNPVGGGLPVNDAELVSFPGVLAGAVTVTAQSRLQGAGARMLFKLGCCESCCCNSCDTCGGSGGSSSSAPTYRRRQVALFAGYRYLRLGEGLQVHEALTSLDPLNPGTFSIFDRFNTENTFSGLDLGGTWDMQRNRWSLELIARVALGGNRQTVNIEGTTTSAVGGVVVTQAGGLLAQTSNIGQHARTVFSAVPEIGLTAGYQVRPGVRLICGYTLMYWTGVVRPGDQIDTSVNPNLIPPQTAPITPLHPVFNYHSTELLVQGFNVGVDTRW